MKNLKITSLSPKLVRLGKMRISKGRKLSESEIISIKNGTIRPILVMQKDEKFLLISGKRRFEAWQKYRKTESIPVYQIETAASPQAILQFAVDDLRIESALNPFEISAVFNLAMKFLDFDRQSWWDFLQVKSSPKWFEKILLLEEISNLVQNFLIQKDAPMKKSLLFTKLTETNLAQIESIISLSPGLNVLCEIAEMMFEIDQKTDGKQVPNLNAIFETEAESREKIKEIRDFLHSIRYPIWNEKLHEVRDLVSALESSSEIRWDRTFEKSGVEISAKIQNAEDWEKWQKFFQDENNSEIFKKIVKNN